VIMQRFSKFSLVAVILLLSLSVFASADTLQLVSANGPNTSNNAEVVGPYGVTDNGTLESVFCLDLSRDMGLNETWTATTSILSTSSSTSDKEAAIILSEINQGKVTATVGQLEIWAISDLSGAESDGLTLSEAFTLKNTIASEARNSREFGNAFYDQFTVFSAVNGSQSSGAEAQDFLGENVVPASVPVIPSVPEPSSLMLFGAGLFGAAGMASRRARHLTSRN
jgi:hypothetical protein